MSVHKSDPLNEERSVIDNLIASSQNLMGDNKEATVPNQYLPQTSGYEMTATKSKIMMKSRRGRTSFTPSQLSDLESAFANTHYPDFQTRKDLSSRLKIPDDRIQVWFQNRRAKWRKTQRQMSSVPVLGDYRLDENRNMAVQHKIVHTTQNSASMMPIYQGIATQVKSQQGDVSLHYTTEKPSPIHHTTVTVKEETTAPPAVNTSTNTVVHNKAQQYLTNQEQLVNIYEKLATPHTTQQLISENQRTAPSLYSLSATITSSGQYIILGPNPNISSTQNYPADVPSTSSSGKH